MLTLLFTLIFQVGAAARPPFPNRIELEAIKRGAVTVTLACDAQLSAPGQLKIDEKRSAVDYQGFRLTFHRTYGGLRLLFAMLRDPGTPIGNETFVTYIKSSNLENFKTLIRVFLELDSTFNGLHVQPGQGFAYDPAVPADYGVDTWNGFRLDWLNDRLIFPDGTTKELSVNVTDALRLMFRARGPVSFRRLFDQIYPGRRPPARTAILGLRAELKHGIDGPGLRLGFDEQREELSLIPRQPAN